MTKEPLLSVATIFLPILSHILTLPGLPANYLNTKTGDLYSLFPIANCANWFFSRERDFKITNVCSYVCPSTKPLNSLKSSSFIFLHSSFIITLHSSFLHFATFKLFSLLNCNTVSLVIDPLTSEGGLKSKKVRKQTPPKVGKTRGF